MPITYVLISSTTLANSTTNTVTFSSIPNTYTDLVIRATTRHDQASVTQLIRLNADSSTIYSNSMLFSSFGNNTVSATRNYYENAGQYAGAVNQGSTSTTADTFSTSEIYIPNYNTTNKKQFFAFGAPENNSSSVSWGLINAHYYQGTAAITSISLLAGTSASQYFAQKSKFYLYGIKNS